MRTIWGFDLGVTSVGFAVIRWNDRHGTEGDGRILRLGVRIFPESRDDDLEPLNAGRRDARLGRRVLRRRRWRRRNLRELLARAGLLPDAQACPPKGQDPILLRKRGQRAALTLNELGWSIFHLLKRRGASGSRKFGPDAPTKAAKKNTDEEKEAKTKRKELKAALGDRILVEHLAAIETSIENPRRRRDQGLERGMIEREFDALWVEQRKHHPSVLTPDLRRQIEEIALYQRPTFFRRRTFGRCDLSGEERALKADWTTQHFEVLQLINDLRVEGGNLRPLDDDERARALQYLEGEGERPVKRPRKGPTDEDADPGVANTCTWAGLRAAIGSLPRGARFTHEREDKNRKLGNKTEIALRAILGPAFPGIPAANAIRSEIATAWHRVEYRPTNDGAILEIRDWEDITRERAALAARAEREWGLSSEQAKALSQISLPHGTGRHSLTAIGKLIPLMETGISYATARKEAYPRAETGPLLNALPGPNQGELVRQQKKGSIDPFVSAAMESLLAGVRNPTVLRTLNELQKIVNKLMQKFGRPDLIRVELGRDLKKPAFKRLAEATDNRDREKKRRDIETELTRNGKLVTGSNILRLTLLREQGCQSPYSGDSISCAQALDPGITEIDHIIPRSRPPHDNSGANKVLCFVRENRGDQAKGERTPYEWLDGDYRWNYLVKTVWPRMVKGGWPEQKRNRCLRQELETETQFTNRQLTDNSVIGTAARDYLGLLFGGGEAGQRAVQIVPGRATAQLRRGWGISIGQLLHDRTDERKKPRDDHRHHAIDALVVALSGPGAIQVLSRWWQAEAYRRHESLSSPWPAFQPETKGKLEDIVVSHRVRAKLSGALHDEQPLGRIKDPYAGEKWTFVIRKRVRAGVGGLSAGEIGRIVDGAVKATITEAIAAANGDLKKALAADIRLPRRTGIGPIIRRVRVRGAKQDQDVYDQVHPDPKRQQFKTSQALHRIDLVECDGQIVPRIGLKRDGIETGRQPNSNGKLIFSLCRGDVLVRITPDRAPELVVVTDFYRNGQIFFVPHWYAGASPRSGSKTPRELLKSGWRKVAVDPIGEWHPAK